MRPSALWIVTATALALAGLWLQYPKINHGRVTSTYLQRQFGYPPDAWWEPIVWPLAFFAVMTILMFVWMLWPSKKTSQDLSSKRWRPPVEGE